MTNARIDRRLTAALALLLLLCGGCAERPPFKSDDRFAPSVPYVATERVWQKGPDGWVYARSLFHLSPSGAWGGDEITRLPTEVVFRAGAAALDLNGYNIVVLQAQRLRQLPDAAVTLFCGWSALEAADSAAGRDLARQRCAAVQTVYRTMGVRTRDLRHKLIAPTAAPATPEAEEAQRSVAVTALATGRTSYMPPVELRGYSKDVFKGIYIPKESYDWRFDLQMPGNVAFDLNSTALDTNARRLLDALVDWLLPGPWGLVLACEEYEDELRAEDVGMVLAATRCRVIRDYVVSHGLCPGLMVHTPRHRFKTSRSSGERHGSWPYAIAFVGAVIDLIPGQTCEGSRNWHETADSSKKVAARSGDLATRVQE